MLKPLVLSSTKTTGAAKLMLKAVHLRNLRVDPAQHPRGQAHLSAASGLVQAGPWLYVVADDEHHLGQLAADAGQAAPVRLHRLLPGDLPHDKDKRKKRKPDLEALALLPATAGYPQGLLMALGSGSRPNREQAFLMALDSGGQLAGATRSLDLSAWYQPLHDDFSDLNIEGAFVADGRFHLLQRGNKGDARNACISYALPDLQDWLAGRHSQPPAVVRTLPLELGEIGGVPLGLTDGAALPGGGWVFSAVAEDTSNSYSDGACAGSAIGWVDAQGVLQRLEAIAGAPKVEGLALAGDKRLLLVTDSDDPDTASRLFALDWS